MKKKIIRGFHILLIIFSNSILLNLSTFEERQKWVASGLDNDPVPLTQAAMLMASQRPVIILDVHQCVSNFPILTFKNVFKIFFKNVTL